MKILVTGGAGFIGSWVAQDLTADSNNKILIMDDLSGGSLENILPFRTKVLFEQLDIRKYGETAFSISKFQPDVLVHLAANAREGASWFQPASVVSRNTTGFANVLSACINYGVKKVVLFSSMSVYGNQQPPFHEKDELKPVDIYGLQKASMEQMLAMLADIHDFDYVIIRPHNVFGIRQSLRDKFRNVIGIWMNRIMRNEPLIIFGDGLQKRAFSYIDNSRPVYQKLISEDVPRGLIVNVGGLTPITIIQLRDIVLEAMGQKSDYPTEFVQARPSEVHQAYCSHLIALDYGYSEPTTLEEDIGKMAEWALAKGPQEWVNSDELEISTRAKLPEPWNEIK